MGSRKTTPANDNGDIEWGAEWSPPRATRPYSKKQSEMMVDLAKALESASKNAPVFFENLLSYHPGITLIRHPQIPTRPSLGHCRPRSLLEVGNLLRTVYAADRALDPTAPIERYFYSSEDFFDFVDELDELLLRFGCPHLRSSQVARMNTIGCIEIEVLIHLLAHAEGSASPAVFAEDPVGEMQMDLWDAFATD